MPSVTSKNGTASGVVIDWSRVWQSGEGRESVKASEGPWLRPSVLDFADHEDPNLGMELVLATTR